MWRTTDFEQHLRDQLITGLNERGSEMFSQYEVTRAKLVAGVFREIAGVEPNLSDHGEDHVAHVQQNALDLIGDDHAQSGLTPIDLYFLAMTILFHDVGNLFGRRDHQKKIGEIFDWARGNDAALRHEKTLVLRAAEAHTGLASDGGRDTLRELSEVDQLFGRSLQLRSVAAILRFADELAEGPIRTSEFRARMKMVDVQSRIYHDYANITHVCADRRNQRVAVAYEIPVPCSEQSEPAQRIEELGALLTFTFERARKLDQERRYARFYSAALNPFKSTQITLNFHREGRLVPLDVPTLELNDKVVPGDATMELCDIHSAYAPHDLAEQAVTFSLEARK